MNQRLSDFLFGGLVATALVTGIIDKTLEHYANTKCTGLGFVRGEVDWRLHSYCVRQVPVVGSDIKLERYNK